MSRRKERKIRSGPDQKLVENYPALGQSPGTPEPFSPQEDLHLSREALPLTKAEEQVQAFAEVLSEALSHHSAKAIARGLGFDTSSNIYKWQQGVKEFPARYLGKLYALTRDRRPIDAALEGSGLLAIEPLSSRRKDLAQVTIPKLAGRAAEAVRCLSEFLTGPNARSRDRARAELRFACEAFEAAYRALEA